MTYTAQAQSPKSATLNSVRALRDVSLKTNPASAFCQAAIPIYIVCDNWGEVVPGYRIEVRSRWTRDSLYLLFICPYQELNLKPNPSTTTETNHLWNWDVAEIFIGSDFHNIRRYKEFEMSPQGEWVDLDIDMDSPHHEGGWTWNSGFQVVVRIDRHRKVWYGAMRIPFRAIDPELPAQGVCFEPTSSAHKSRQTIESSLAGSQA